MLLYLPALTALFGASLGAYRAFRRGGDVFDLLLWGFGHACAFGLPVLAGLVLLDLFF